MNIRIKCTNVNILTTIMNDQWVIGAARGHTKINNGTKGTKDNISTADENCYMGLKTKQLFRIKY